MPDPLTSVLAGVVFGLALAAPPGPMNAVIAEESVVRGWLSGFTAGLGAMTADGMFCALTLLGVVGFVENAPTVRGLMVGVGGVLMLYFAYGAAVDATESGGFLHGAPAAVDGDGESGGHGGRAPDGGAPDAGAPGGGAPGGGAPDGGAAGGGAPADGSVEGGDDRPQGESKGFRKAFALAMTNPYQILFWLSAGVGMLRVGTLDVLAHTPHVGTGLEGVLVVQTGSPALVVGFFAGIGLWVVAFPGTLVALGKRVDRFADAVAWGSALVLAVFGIVFLADAAGTLL